MRSPFLLKPFSNSSEFQCALRQEFSVQICLLVMIEKMQRKKTRNASHFNNRGWRNNKCLHSQFKIVKYLYSARLLFKKRSRFGYYMRFPYFSFLKEKPLDFICALQ